MPRVVIAPEDVRDRTISIRDPATLHHLVRVLHVSPGEAVECVDGAGGRYATRVSRRSGRELVLDILERAADPASKLSVWLVPALIRPERFEWLVQKATELGVDRLSPVMTARSVIRLRAGRAEGRLKRWRRIAQEAAQQCGRATVPRIDAPVAFQEGVLLLSSEFRVWSSESVKPVSELRTPNSELVLLPTLAVAAVPLHEALADRPSLTSAAVLIGPEGDFTVEEVTLAQRHGAGPVSLGRRVLRSETAAIAVLAILQHAAGEV